MWIFLKIHLVYFGFFEGDRYFILIICRISAAAMQSSLHCPVSRRVLVVSTFFYFYFYFYFLDERAISGGTSERRLIAAVLRNVISVSTIAKVGQKPLYYGRYRRHSS